MGNELILAEVADGFMNPLTWVVGVCTSQENSEELIRLFEEAQGREPDYFRYKFIAFTPGELINHL